MKTLNIAEGITMPVNAVTEKLAFLGRTGSGKSYGATKLAEQMIAADAQVVVLDPVGIWYGLRSAADGKAPGIPIAVFGGLHGDLPLESTAGALLADLVVDKGLSCVIDVSQFEHDTDKARFAADIRIACEQCGEKFRFLGLPCGVDLDGAAVSADGTEARLAIGTAETVANIIDGDCPVGFTVRKTR